jgi:hypothetical protein
LRAITVLWLLVPLLVLLLLLQEVNAAIVATNAGTRLTLGELDADGVEAWVDHKKAQVASKLIALEMRGAGA